MKRSEFTAYLKSGSVARWNESTCAWICSDDEKPAVYKEAREAEDLYLSEAKVEITLKEAKVVVDLSDNLHGAMNQQFLSPELDDLAEKLFAALRKQAAQTIKRIDSIKQIKGGQKGYCWGYVTGRKIEVFPHPEKDGFEDQYVQVQSDDSPKMEGFIFLAFAASADFNVLAKQLFEQGWRLNDWGASLTDTDDEMSLFKDGEQLAYWADGVSRDESRAFSIMGLPNDDYHDEALYVLSKLTEEA